MRGRGRGMGMGPPPAMLALQEKVAALEEENTKVRAVLPLALPVSLSLLPLCSVYWLGAVGRTCLPQASSPSHLKLHCIPIQRPASSVLRRTHPLFSIMRF